MLTAVHVPLALLLVALITWLTIRIRGHSPSTDTHLADALRQAAPVER